MVFPLESFKKDWHKPANLISLARLLLAFIPVVMLLNNPDDVATRWWVIAIFLVVSLTDMLDGYVARRFNSVTDWGKFLDPAVDKVLIAGMLVALSVINPWLWPVTALIFLREIIVTLQIRSRGTLVAAIWSGKVKMAMQVVMVLVLVMPIWLWLQVLVTIVTVGVTIWSWVDYYQKFVRVRHE